MNPMNISLVVENICKYLNLEELKVCRTLNREWKKQSEKYFWKSNPLKLSSLNSGARMSILRFMEIFKDPHHNDPNAAILRRYQNFDVQGQRLVSETEEQVGVFYDFLSKVGPRMTSLTLNTLQIFRDLQDVYDILTSKYAPNLEFLRLESVVMNGKPWKHRKFTRLTFEDNTCQTQNKNLRKLSLFEVYWTNWRNITIPWLDVFLRHPNMKALQIEGFQNIHCEEIATALVAMRQNEKEFHLTELEWRFVLNFIYDRASVLSWGEILNTLQAAKMPLKRLGLTIKTSTTSLDEEALISFLQAQSGTLKSLMLNETLPHPFPLLENLEQFETRLNSSLPDFRFLPRMPNLKSLKMEFDVTRSQCVFPSVLVPNKFLTVFRSGSRKQWSVTELEQLLALLPNIQVLEMQLDKPTFTWVSQNFKNLKELTIYRDEYNDFSMYGGTTIRNGIANLKELEKLVVYERQININKYR